MATTKTCGCCNGSKNFAQFYKSPIDGTYTAICKNCCRKKFKQYQQVTGSDSAGLWLVLAELGIPFYSGIWKQTETYMATAGPNTDIIMTYLRYLSESGIVVEGFWESDKMLDQLVKTDVDRGEVEEDEFDPKEQCRIWGTFTCEKGLDREAYDFLNQTFEEYTSDLLEMDTNLEKRFRDLAKCELRLRKANESGDGGEISKAQESLNKQLALLKMNDFNSGRQSEIDKHISRISWTIENTKPCECKDLEKYKDFSGFGKTWDDMFRAARNLIAGTRDFPDIPKGEQ